uniref:Enoyl-CoA hydratase n=1 Tax=Mycena chlorophos TaxID=658473 RepID=A0ABQ0M9M5_MYCCL|nr:enoyl-CoA hydratase [Mycena chlorophos]
MFRVYKHHHLTSLGRPPKQAHSSFRAHHRGPKELRHALTRAFASQIPHEAFLEPLPEHPGITCLSLNRPAAKNAISTHLLKELRESLAIVHADRSVRALILRSSTPGSFCAGADLVERRTMTDAQVSQFLTDLRDAMGRLEGLPMPTICAIDGPALGGGLEMAMACDLRVASSTVEKIGLPETGLGIIPGAGGTQRAARLLGQSRAKDLIFTGRLLTASQALEWGLVDYVSDPGTTAFDKALSLAIMIARNAPLAVRAAKHAISRAEDLPLEAGLDFERATYNLLIPSSDRLEALQAFREKRRPIFKGE